MFSFCVQTASNKTSSSLAVSMNITGQRDLSDQSTLHIIIINMCVNYLLFFIAAFRVHLCCHRLMTKLDSNNLENKQQARMIVFLNLFILSVLFYFFPLIDSVFHWYVRIHIHIIWTNGAIIIKWSLYCVTCVLYVVSLLFYSFAILLPSQQMLLNKGIFILCNITDRTDRNKISKKINK